MNIRCENTLVKWKKSEIYIKSLNLIFVAFQSELRQYIVYITFSDKQKAFKTVDICEQ